MDTFDSTYKDYLDKLARIDFSARAKNLDLPLAADVIRLRFFNRPHNISRHGVVGPDGSAATPAVGTVLLEYVLRNETIHPAVAEKISFRAPDHSK